ncbi:MAG: DUF5658 family protein [Isosphaeraceae bacterium]|nr:DUF5658 family protein [Isosphaeraceae bacterium]
MRPDRPAPRSPIAALLGFESVVFVLLSAADLFMTYRLLWKARFYESNPIAQFFFARWNIAGLTLFKFSLVIFIIVIAETIERYRPRVGRLILILGCVAAAAAAFHGYRLEAEHG